LSFRRLKTYGGIPSANGTRLEPLPSFVDAIIDNILQRGIPFPQRPNHILLNEYSAGMGIGAHFDGPLYDSFVAVLNLQAPAMFYMLSANKLATSKSEDCSVPSTTQDGYAILERIYLQPRSLLLFSEDAYLSYKHGIPHSLFDEAESSICNAHLLDPDTCGKKVWRNGTFVRDGIEETTETAASWKPRLSLTIRYAKPASSELLETESDRSEARRDVINFYRSVSEYN
jgi:hypothetical protein